MSSVIKTPPGSMLKTPGYFSVRQPYKAYRSPYGPQYQTAANYHGITARTAIKYGITAGAFGGVAGIFVLFFFAEVPRVRIDIMQKVPVIGSYFINEIPPEDNPF